MKNKILLNIIIPAQSSAVIILEFDKKNTFINF